MIHKSLKFALSLTGAALCVAGPVAAATLSKAKLAQYAKLPDWSGVWGVKGNFDILDKPNATDQDFERGVAADPPYNAEWAAKYKEDKRRSRLQGIKDAPDALADTVTLHCVTGMPRIIATPYEYQFIHSPEMSLIIAGGEVRRIYVDGRKRPDEDTIWPKAYGWSTGQWHGEVLEVETTHIYPGLWGDSTAIQFSDQLKINERIYLVDADTLQDDAVITDPVALTRPWKVSRQYVRKDFEWVSDGELCHAPEDRHPVEGGRVTTKLK